MRNLRDIKKRITSVHSTQKLTKAMKLVAAARLRKAQDNLIKMRPYAKLLVEAANIVAARVEEQMHPLLAVRHEKNIIMIILTSDKGLCGSFNANILRKAETTIKEYRQKSVNIKLVVSGKKGLAYFRHRGVDIYREIIDIYNKPSVSKTTDTLAWCIDEFIRNETDAVYVVYNEFKTAVVHNVIFEKILPIEKATLEPTYREVDFIFEPKPDILLEPLLKEYAFTELHRTVLESIASEHGARMTAMENATKNADEMIRNLTLEYNKARQASITKELMDIVGGAEAQRKAN